MSLKSVVVVGVLGVSCPKLVMQTKMLIEREASWEEALALLDAADMEPTANGAVQGY